VISRGHDGIISIQGDNGTSSLVCQENNQTMVMPCGALPSSSPCFFFNEGGKQKQKHVWDWKHRDRDSHNSSWREREKERDPKEFLEIVSMVTNRCRSKYISSLSPLGQQQQMQPKQFKQE